MLSPQLDGPYRPRPTPGAGVFRPFVVKVTLAMSLGLALIALVAEVI